jgi:hypothetical protein
MPESAAAAVRDFLLQSGGQSYCDVCLARVLKLSVAQAQRAAVGLAKTAGFQRKVTECSRYERTRSTTTALCFRAAVGVLRYQRAGEMDHDRLNRAIESSKPRGVAQQRDPATTDFLHPDLLAALQPIAKDWT